MKLTSKPKHFFIIAVPFWALTLFCTAQNNTPAPAAPPQSAVIAPQNLHAAGTVSSYDAKGLTVLEPITGSMTVYMTNTDTTFVDTHDHFISPDKVIVQTPVKVYYTMVGNTVLATKVVVDIALNTEGSLIEVSPGLIVIQSSVPASQVRFVSNNTLQFVDHKGKPAPPDSVKLGAAVRVFYTKAGDTLLASKVELLGSGTDSPVTTKATTTTTTREINR